MRHIIEHRGRYAACAASGAPVHVVFLQGSIRDHIPKQSDEGAFVSSLLDDAARPGGDGASTSSAQDHPLPCRAHQARPDFTIQQWRGGRLDPLDPPLRLGAWFESRMGRPWPHRPRWWLGALFCISARLIGRNAAGVYEALVGDLDAVNPVTGHYLERAWVHVFLDE